MEELKYLTEYYSNYDEEGRLATKYGQVEFITTMKYHLSICERSDLIGITHHALDIFIKSR